MRQLEKGHTRHKSKCRLDKDVEQDKHRKKEDKKTSPMYFCFFLILIFELIYKTS